jgi:hypothetical protein
VPDVGDRRARLRADCSRCVAICCVAPAFAASADFAIDKPAGVPCPNLRSDDGCSVHDRLRPLGFPGCAVFDCFGAGQQVTQVTFGGVRGPLLFDAFTVMRQLHELLWYLNEALDLPGPFGAELEAALTATERLTELPADELVVVPVAEHRTSVNELLLRVSSLTRAGTAAVDHRGADLVGRRLRDLRGASLRGALLIGADLRGADLNLADVTGADFRGADVRGADLSTTIFLSQAQLAAAVGDETTRLPPPLHRPTHWTGK